MWLSMIFFSQQSKKSETDLFIPIPVTSLYLTTF